MSGANLEALSDPFEVFRLLHGGDRLAHCHPTGWRLVSSDLAVAESAVNALKRGASQKAAGDWNDFGGGRLVPLDDGLFGGFSQTWIWVAGYTAVSHTGRRKTRRFSAAAADRKTQKAGGNHIPCIS